MSRKQTKTTKRATRSVRTKSGRSVSPAAKKRKAKMKQKSLAEFTAHLKSQAANESKDGRRR